MSHTARRALFGASMLGGMVAAASALAAPALPTGGRVAAGAASIGASGATLTVSQSSVKAIVDWSSFSVGQGGTVQFDNGSGATLNRVTGASVSSIDGLLSATGSVYLINPNGVIVGKSGVVNTGGSFVASTLDVGNTNFLAGGPLTFSGPSTASVVNLGKVGSLGGNVGLIAATVRNDGTIQAARGEAGLAAGTTVTLDDTANDAGGLFSVKVGGASTSATNASAISAAAVELRAQQGNVYALAGNAGGVINATAVDGSGGTIKLISEAGTTTVAGTLSARGANGAGGQIETSGETLDVGVASVDTHGGAWLLDPTSLIVNAAAATTIDAALGSGNVTLATNASGPPTGPGTPGDNSGDIFIDAPITWSASTTLTLDSVGAIAVNAPITAAGNGSVVLDYGASGLKFDLGLTGFLGSMSFAPGTGEGIAGQSLTINGKPYTLLHSMVDVAAINGSSGHFALAGPITSTTTYTNAIVANFTGTLEGLGNTITGLTINGGSNSDVGLIGTLGGGGVVRDIGLVGGSVEGDSAVGALVGSVANVGLNVGAVTSSYATGAVSGSTEVGGLVGRSAGRIEGSYATGPVSATGGMVGGLVGYNNQGLVETSYATGAVSAAGDMVGGLVGYNYGEVGDPDNSIVETSYAKGAVSGGNDVGGLVGYNRATVETSYATGAVAGAASVGGLVGSSGEPVANVDAVIETSYATGAVSATAGGLVGAAQGEGEVSTSYATGAVSGTTDVGGLIGFASQSVETSYATGAVSGTTDVGGLIGFGDAPISNTYFDTQTAFNNLTGPGLGSGSAAGITSLTTAQLQSNAGGFMTNLGAPFAGGTGGLFPYLVHFFPSGVQAIVGTATSGGAPAGAGQVGLYSGGVLLGGGMVSTGANGYIYLAVAAGTLGASGDKIGADLTLAGGASLSGLVYTDAGAVNSGVLTLPALAAGQDAQTTGEFTLSALHTDLSATFSASTYAGLQPALAGIPTAITATGASFTVNQTVSTAAGLSIQTVEPGSPLTIADPITFSGTGALTLAADESTLAIDAPIRITGGGQAVLDFGGLSFDVGLTSFGGSLSFAAGTGEGIAGQVLTLNGTSYGLLYSMADVAAINGSSGHFALAGPITSTTTYTGAVVANFLGTFEGLGNSITGLTIAGGSANIVGLFGQLGAGGPAEVSDLGLIGGSVSGHNQVGGLVGINFGNVNNARIGDKVAGTGVGIGGLAGENIDQASISGSAASGTVSGTNGDREIGGLVGYNAANVSNDIAFGRVVSPSSLYVAGLVGYNTGVIGGAFASGAVTDTGVGAGVVGGLVGYNAGIVEDTYAYSGHVSGGIDVGGLIGANAGTVSTSWSSGVVSGTSNVGGAIGLQSAGTLASLYWDEGLSGTTTGVGSGSSAGVTGIGGTTRISPTAQATYGGFSFTTTWNIIPGSSRPFLRSLFP